MSKDLIERLESAEAGSRELDGLIERALFPERLIMTDGGSVGPVKREAKREPIGERPDIPGEVIADCTGTAFYTTSIDAAVALVERVLPGQPLILGARQTLETRPWARIGRPEHGADTTSGTIPLAICAALLRALNTQETGNG